jgi:hypothetical protein
MKSRWNCPYCEQTGNRRWNIAVHVERKHPGLYNPLPSMRQTRPFNTYSSQAKPQSANSFLPQDDLPESVRTIVKLDKFQNLLQEIKQLSKIELNFLIIAISNLPNYTNYSDSLI